MKSFFQNTASFLIAFGILLGILFLPDTTYEPIKNIFNIVSKATTTTYALGSHILSNFVSAIVTGLFLFLFIRSIKRDKDNEV